MLKNNVSFVDFITCFYYLFVTNLKNIILIK